MAVMLHQTVLVLVKVVHLKMNVAYVMVITLLVQIVLVYLMVAM